MRLNVGFPFIHHIQNFHNLGHSHIFWFCLVLETSLDDEGLFVAIVMSGTKRLNPTKTQLNTKFPRDTKQNNSIHESIKCQLRLIFGAIMTLHVDLLIWSLDSMCI